MQPTNYKLSQRGTFMIMELIAITFEEANLLLKKYKSVRRLKISE